MKRFIVFVLFVLIGLFVCGIIANSATLKKTDTLVVSKDTITQTDSSLVVVTPTGKTIVPDATLPLYICAFLGLFGRAIWNTYKGVKNTTNGTPTTFDFMLWLKDNVLSKLASVMAIIFAIQKLVNLPTILFWQIVMCILAVILGVFADYAMDKLKWLTNQVKIDVVNKTNK